MSAASGGGDGSVVVLDDAFMSDMRADNPFTRVSVSLSTPAKSLWRKAFGTARQTPPRTRIRLRVREITTKWQRNGNEMRVC